MPDVRAVREPFQFQAGSEATITVTAVDDDGPVDLTGHTLSIVAGDTLTASTADPTAGTRVFSFTAEDTAAVEDADGGRIALVDGDGNEWLVGPCWASRSGTAAQDHTVAVTVGAAEVALTISAAIGGGGVSLPIAQSDVTGLSDALAGKASTAEVAASLAPFRAIPINGVEWHSSMLSTDPVSPGFSLGFDVCYRFTPASDHGLTDVFAELFSQTRDGPADGAEDLFELAVHWLDGVPMMFFEWTAIGGEHEEAFRLEHNPEFAPYYTYFDASWQMNPGDAFTGRTSLVFDDGAGNLVLTHWREAGSGETSDASEYGLDWLKTTELVYPATTSIETSGANPWHIGRGQGATMLEWIAARNGIGGDLLVDLSWEHRATVDLFVDGLGTRWKWTHTPDLKAPGTFQPAEHWSPATDSVGEALNQLAERVAALEAALAG